MKYIGLFLLIPVHLVKIRYSNPKLIFKKGEADHDYP